ncbi:uncharacterized protein KY384_003529 [Bacidia gigantensis]|uniref:uncharacterized protein n=1 Tax=Bacidia gigantensis TaxID=2732470 RepID=UPI001D0365A5|nr:uncharacterized protein KY384_003529 [Bacidia gigantensis]KAG8531893.1 hypothetical protein KY384_003529 [Bacidia gigantensis]
MSNSLGRLGVLPCEIRNEIYQQNGFPFKVFEPTFQVYDWRVPSVNLQDSTGAILLVSKIVYHEASGVLYNISIRKSLFKFRLHWDETWLAKFRTDQDDHQRYPEVKTQAVTRYEWPNIDIPTMLRMKKVAIQVDISSLPVQSDLQRSLRFKYADAARAWCMDRFLDRSNLGDCMIITFNHDGIDFRQWIYRRARFFLYNFCLFKVVVMVIQRPHLQEPPGSIVTEAYDAALKDLQRDVEGLLGPGNIDEIPPNDQFAATQITFHPIKYYSSERSNLNTNTNA